MNRKKTEEYFDVVIAGAGIAGLTLALLLGKQGMRIALIEKYPPAPLKGLEPSARTIALMNSSLNIIKATGIWRQVSGFSNPMHAMRIIDASIPGADTIDETFAAADLDLNQFGFNIPNNILRAALYEEIKNVKTITPFMPDAFQSFEILESAIQITTENAHTLTASLLVGTDGRNSMVRSAAGIALKDHDYRQSAITCIIAHEKNHHNTAIEFHRAGGPFALVPMPDNQSAIVWVEKTARADELLKLKKQDFESALQKETHGLLGSTQLHTNPENWPLIAIKAERLTAPRLALAAEAAHVMSPITAQGLNLSLRDIAALAETIIDAMRAGIDPGSAAVLKHYEQRRGFDIDTRTFGVDAMNRIVSQELPFMKNMRRRGLGTLSALQPLKNFAMTHALAPNIDQGRLAAGEKL